MLYCACKFRKEETEMTQKALSKSLQVILAGVFIMGLALYFYVVPDFGRIIAEQNPEFAYCFWPWIIFIWVTGLPIAAAMVFAWRISASIGRDRSFSQDNARYFKYIAYLAIGDGVYYFLGNVVFAALSMSHPGFLLAGIVITFGCLAVAEVCMVLSHLVKKAADLEEESELTI